MPAHEHLGAYLDNVLHAMPLRLAETHGLRIEERPFTVDEAMEAAEVFFTSASTFVIPVIAIDGRPIGTGRPGRLAPALREHYIAAARKSPGTP